MFYCFILDYLKRYCEANVFEFKASDHLNNSMNYNLHRCDKTSPVKCNSVENSGLPFICKRKIEHGNTEISTDDAMVVVK